MDRLAVEMDGAGAAIARIAALLDPEPAGLPQIGAQALAGAGIGLVGMSVDGEPHACVSSSSRISCAKCRVMCRRQSGRPCTSS